MLAGENDVQLDDNGQEIIRGQEGDTYEINLKDPSIVLFKAWLTDN